MVDTRKTAIVTGASRGIGAGLVEAFLKRGYNVVANSRHITEGNPPHFEHEGAFRSWLIRVLIEEAIAILRENQGTKNAAAAVVKCKFHCRGRGKSKV